VLARHWKLVAALVPVVLIVATLGAAYAVLEARPDLGAQAADDLRNVFGDQAVSQLENWVYQAKDTARSAAYEMRPTSPNAPWAADNQAAITVTVTSGAVATVAPPKVAQANQGAHRAQASQPVAQPPAFAWPPAALVVSGTMPGAGQWQPYLKDANGQVVAYRTYMQPDPGRLYAYAAIVAFNLDVTRLHFVLGTNEPVSSVVVDRSGRVPPADAQPGVLIAAFNGGFKARHGHFGAMAGGVVVIPPRNDLGTVALYRDGRVRIGQWGSEITDDPAIVAWRQNGPLVIHDGQVNPQVTVNDPQSWGYVPGLGTPIWRSGLGISADGHVLYYVAGSTLTLDALSRTLLMAGAQQAMQLDINNFWVHFEAMRSARNSPDLQAVPLLPEMTKGANRFLQAYSRDFFYVTTGQ
jgi:hypothetical protein